MVATNPEPDHDVGAAEANVTPLKPGDAPNLPDAAAAVKEFLHAHLDDVAGPKFNARGTVTWSAACPKCDRPVIVTVTQSSTVNAKCTNATCGITTWKRLQKAVTGEAGDEIPEFPQDETGRGRPGVDITNEARAADWLTIELGTNGLSGVFKRGNDLISTPLIGQDGYQAPPVKYDAQGKVINEHDTNGPATIKTVESAWINSTIASRYYCCRLTKKEGWTYSLFPQKATASAVGNIDLLPNVHEVTGITHTPTMRPDGTVLDQPGYDHATGLLYLPNDNYPRVPANPTPQQVTKARELLLEMIDGFDFVTDYDRANYLALLLSAVLRTMIGGDRKLGAITAHQPGSGKSLLAWILGELFGSAVRSEFPEGEAEVGKVLFSLLLTTTAPFLVFDNVDKSGTVKSGTLAGFLTQREISDRVLGASETKQGVNDRMVILTGNNMEIGGDIARRSLLVRIDPKVPNPEERTDFAIEDLNAWVTEKRGMLVTALLILVRAWVLAGRPVEKTTSDSFAPMMQAVNGILSVGGFKDEDGHTSVAGHKEIAAQTKGDEFEDWGDMFAAVYDKWSDKPWTGKTLLEQISSGGFERDILPESLALAAEKRPVTDLGRMLGKGLAKHTGRWFDGYTIRDLGKERKVTKWKVEKYEDLAQQLPDD